jgi:hypothetical protein
MTFWRTIELGEKFIEPIQSVKVPPAGWETAPKNLDDGLKIGHRQLQ